MEMRKGLVSVIILTKDNLEYTKMCLNSIFEQTSLVKTPFEVIVVDNASKDGTQDYLKGLSDAKKIKVMFNKENVGFPEGNNQGASIAEGEFICLLNNDTIVTKDWLSNLLRVLRSEDKLAAVGPYCNHSSGEQMVPQCPPYQDDKTLQEMALKFSGPMKNVNFLVFFCTLIKRSVWDEIGGLDEDFSPGNYEDNLFCYRVIERGYFLKVVSHFIWHWGSISWKGQNQDPVKYKAYLELLGKNQKIFMQKIGKYKTIGLCMIVGDAESPETLKRCLDSVVDYVDEINIVFNYKWFPKQCRLKKLRKIAGMYTYKMSDALPANGYKYIKWTNFSDMRNESLKMNNCDYTLILDDDDVMITPQGPRDVILKNPEADYFKCKVHSLNEKGGEEIIMQTRLFKNKKEYRYQKLCHEDIVLSMKDANAERCMTNIEISHLGYDSIKTVMKKNKRNLKLLNEEIKSGKADQLTYFHLISSKIILNEYKPKDVQLKELGKIMDLINYTLDHFKLLDTDPLTTKLWVTAGVICMFCSQTVAAKSWLHKAFDKNSNPEAAVNLASLYIKEKNIDKAIEILTAIDNLDSFPISNMALNAKEIEFQMLYQLGDCYVFKKEFEKAEKYYKEALFVKKDLLIADRLCKVLRALNRHSEAALITVNLVNTFPGYWEGWKNLALEEIKANRYRTAKLFLEEVNKYKPNDKDILFNISMVDKILRKEK
jgi:GT2 family glycosyltransferase/tetratricopeptide (TPR) repeat protein